MNENIQHMIAQWASRRAKCVESKIGPLSSKQRESVKEFYTNSAEHVAVFGKRDWGFEAHEGPQIDFGSGVIVPESDLQEDVAKYVQFLKSQFPKQSVRFCPDVFRTYRSSPVEFQPL
jgi:hypothetical protein